MLHNNCSKIDPTKTIDLMTFLAEFQGNRSSLHKLYAVFSHSLNPGIAPSDLQSVSITPVHKKDKKEPVTNITDLAYDAMCTL